jgi:flagellar hook-associated protein 2
MTSSPVSATSSSANFVMALGTGSGVDIQNLAQNLVNAEKQPKAELIQKSIDKAQARIKGYDVVARAISQIQEAVSSLASPSAFASFATGSSMPAAVTITGGAGATTGAHKVTVSKLATAQRSVSSNLTPGVAVAGGPITLSLTIAGAATPVNIAVGDTTPEGIVSAVNAQGLPVKASLVNTTGSSAGPVRIVLSGETGAANSFTIASSNAAGAVDLGFVAPGATDGGTLPNQRAQDAELTVNGLLVSRPTNTVTGVLPGATLSLTDTTGNGTAVVSLTRDTAPVKEKIKQIVANYNDLQTILNAATDPNSTVDGLGASLVGDSSIRGIRERVRNILMPMSGSSAGGITASGSSSLSGLRDLGIVIDRDGTMKFAHVKSYDPTQPTQNLLAIGDETGLDTKLANSFDEVAALFQGKNGAPGIAQDMADQLRGNGRYLDTSFTPSSPLKTITSIQRSASGLMTAGQERLAALEVRMSALLERYMKQFSVMDSLVGQSKSLKSSIENSFKGMSNTK